MRAEEFVAPRRAIPADDVDLKIRIAKFRRQVVQEVEHAGIVLMNFAGAVVAQILAEASQGFLIIALVIAVDDIQALSGMSVEKMKVVGTRRTGLQSRLGCGGRGQPAGGRSTSIGEN